MTRKTALLLALSVLAILDALIPFVPLLALLLLYVVMERPAWFLAFVREVYGSE
ncbi:MAG: hypothetical protein KDI83_12005 [Gammaproteobacteria bacterium]|nr:hypothetical protein [Gammaproteobacteria bacterium]